MHYVISDIHGKAALFDKLLEVLQLTEEDRVIILGDMIDKGEDSPGVVSIIRNNKELFYPMKGNHTAMYCQWYMDPERKWYDPYAYDSYGQFTRVYHSRRKLNELAEWMQQLPVGLKLTIHEKTFLLGHASTRGILNGKLNERELLWNGGFIRELIPVDGCISIVGHVMTWCLRSWFGDDSGNPEIYHNKEKTMFDIDCGACRTGVLGALRLEDLKEFYVSERT